MAEEPSHRFANGPNNRPSTTNPQTDDTLTRYPSPYRSSDHTLPIGWESYIDSLSGERYYCNLTTGITTWEHPQSNYLPQNPPNSQNSQNTHTNRRNSLSRHHSNERYPTHNTAVPQNDDYSDRQQSQNNYQPPPPPDHTQNGQYPRHNGQNGYQNMPHNDTTSNRQSPTPTSSTSPTPQDIILDQDQIDAIPPKFLDLSSESIYGLDFGITGLIFRTFWKTKFLTILTFLLFFSFFFLNNTIPISVLFRGFPSQTELLSTQSVRSTPVSMLFKDYERNFYNNDHQNWYRNDQNGYPHHPGYGGYNTDNYGGYNNNQNRYNNRDSYSSSSSFQFPIFPPPSPLVGNRFPFIRAAGSAMIYGIYDLFVDNNNTNTGNSSFSFFSSSSSASSQSQSPSFPSLDLLTPLELIYIIYICSFIIPAGFIPISWYCNCGISSCCFSDQIIETLKKKFLTQNEIYHIIDRIDTIRQSTPQIIMTVVCSHNQHNIDEYIQSGSPHGRNNNQLFSNVPSGGGQNQEVITFSATRTIPIIRWRDISPPSIVLGDLLDQSRSNQSAVSYCYEYELHPQDEKKLEILKKIYYNENCHRDIKTDVRLRYSLLPIMPSSTIVDVVIKKRNFSYWFTQILFFNPFSFFFWSYLGLLLPILIIFYIFIHYVSYTSTKYLHIGTPSPNHDIIITGRR